VEIASGSSAAVTGDGGGALGVFKSLTPNSDLVNDTSPQLGGPLDVNGQSIVSASNGNIAITPDGTGAVNITGTANITGDLDVDNLNLNGNSISATDTNGNISVSPDGSGHVIMSGLVYPNADGSANDFLKTDGTGNLSFGGQSLLFVPGMVMPYAGASSPTGWLTCYGQAISRTTYSALFAAIGTIHGAGDGSTTFNLPDLRGRTISGQDDMGGSSANRLTNQSGGVDGDTLGAAGGAETHTLTVPELPDSFYYNSNLNSVDDRVDNYANANFTARVADVISHTSQGGGGAHNNVQPTLILNYIIKT
jgi:microcystin-dependent protein